MCHFISYLPFRRNVCLCLATYIIFGLKTNCGVMCTTNKIFPPNEHSKLIFYSVTNDSHLMDVNQLHNFVMQLKRTCTASALHHHASEMPKCYSAEDMFNFFPNNTKYINHSSFADLFPTFIYELHNQTCHEEPDVKMTHRTFDWKAMLAAIAAVLVVSASGLMVVCLVPLMSRSFYNVVTQFLIALSVGSLIGDAFLHLIPHALIQEQEHEHHDHADHTSNSHQNAIFHALITLLGIYAFFLTERLTIICQNRMSRRKIKRQYITGGFPALENYDIDPHSHHQSRVKADSEFSLEHNQNQFQTATDQVTCGDFVGENHKDPKTPAIVCQLSVPEGLNCASGVRSPIICSDAQLCNRPPDRPMDNTRCTDYLADVNDLNQSVWSFSQRNTTRNEEERLHIKPIQSDITYEVSKQHSPTTFQKPTALDHNNEFATTNQRKLKEAEGNQIDPRKNAHASVDPTVTTKNIRTRTYLNGAEDIHTHPHRDKPHGHHHGHSHDLSSVRSIAYTIIAGDGLHNFCDGIAIGAAFAKDLGGGLSTAIAVLCHELPHELGDFAVLLHAGMSVKSALFYNMISSLLCAAGMLIGLFLGRLPSLNSSLFMLTAGMFVYIALVNMMPELSTNQLKGDKRCHKPTILFLWQNLGIWLGYAIMLAIALNEHRMITV